jgi:hypothetical protein
MHRPRVIVACDLPARKQPEMSHLLILLLVEAAHQYLCFDRSSIRTTMEKQNAGFLTLHYREWAAHSCMGIVFQNLAGQYWRPVLILCGEVESTTRSRHTIWVPYRIKWRPPHFNGRQSPHPHPRIFKDPLPEESWVASWVTNFAFDSLSRLPGV